MSEFNPWYITVTTTNVTDMMYKCKTIFIKNRTCQPRNDSVCSNSVKMSSTLKRNLWLLNCHRIVSSPRSPSACSAAMHTARLHSPCTPIRSWFAHYSCWPLRLMASINQHFLSCPSDLPSARLWLHEHGWTGTLCTSWGVSAARSHGGCQLLAPEESSVSMAITHMWPECIPTIQGLVKMP